MSSVGSEGSSEADDTQSARFSAHFNPVVTAFLFLSSIPRVKTAPKPTRFSQSKNRPLRLHAAILFNFAGVCRASSFLYSLTSPRPLNPPRIPSDWPTSRASLRKSFTLPCRLHLLEEWHKAFLRSTPTWKHVFFLSVSSF
jgi:hypothetical protein